LIHFYKRFMEVKQLFSQYNVSSVPLP